MSIKIPEKKNILLLDTAGTNAPLLVEGGEKDIRYENEQFVNSSKEKIRDYINGDIPTVEKTVTTIKRTYSIDGNNDRNLMTSRNMMNIVNNNERINSMDDREINPDMNRILTQGNKLTLSQERYMDENEKEEIS